MKKAALVAAILLAVPAHAQTAEPTVAEFLGRVQAAIAGGQLSEDGPAMQRLRQEVGAAGKAIRARQQAERAAGTKPTLCVPEKAEANNEFLTHLAAIPAERRTMSLTDGMASYVRAKYPCPAG